MAYAAKERAIPPIVMLITAIVAAMVITTTLLFTILILAGYYNKCSISHPSCFEQQKMIRTQRRFW